MLKKIIIFMMIALFSITVLAIPSADTVVIKMCEYITIVEPDGPVNCQNEITQIGQLDDYTHFDVEIPDLTDDDVIGIYIYSPSDVLEFSGHYNKIEDTEKFTGTHLTHTFEVADKEGGEWKFSLKVYDSDADEIIELASMKFTIIEETTRDCETGFDFDYYCCESPNTCPRGSRVAEGICETGVCCNAESNCMKTISGTVTRTQIVCEDVPELQDCDQVIGDLYNYSIHGPLDVDVTIDFDVRDISISCFDPTDIAVGYYDEANNVWVDLPSYVVKVSEGIYEVSSVIDYLGYVGVVKTSDCVEVGCTYGGFQFDPTSGYVDVSDDLTFKICGLIPGCDVTQDGVCSEGCPLGKDPDCDQETCENTNDNCCLISHDGVCDPDCHIRADPDCCDKTEDGCCPGDYERSGSQNCDKNCGLADPYCEKCTSNSEDCCHPAADGTCDIDCIPIPPYMGNPDPDCGDRTSDSGDSCNPICDGICDRDCIFGTDPDCVGYCARCGNGFCDPGETKAKTGPSSCGEDERLRCGWTWIGSPCATDCGTVTCHCEEIHKDGH